MSLLPSPAVQPVVIGGLFSSTVLTLLIVPALYLLLERARQKRGYGADQRGLF